MAKEPATVRDGALREVRGPDPQAESAEDSRVVIYRVAPTKMFGYARGETFTATCWRF